jgi:tetratricopeptide (TPR) repeat protein
MAPEQRRGASDAKSDQFAFCVTLFEALYGRHPHAVRAPDGSLVRTDGEAPPAVPDDRRISKRAARALVRGLAPSPADRFPSMKALLAELEPRSGGRAVQAGAVVGVVTTALVAVVIARQPAAAGRTCADAGELAGVWDDDVKRRAGDAFAATGLPYAAAAWRGTERKLDDFARAWAEMRRDACEATHVRGTQSGELLDARMVCLARRRAELGALAAELVRADAVVVEQSIDAAYGLDELASCADVVALSARTPVPADPALRARLDEATALSARAQAAATAGRLDEATALATRAVERARAVGHAPTTAAALTVLAGLQDSKDAEETLHLALQAAELGRDDVVKVDAWLQLVYVVGYRLGRPREGERWAAYAELVLGRLGEHPELRRDLLRYQGMMAALSGRPSDASAYYREALAIAEQTTGPDSFEAGSIHAYWAVAHGQVGDVDAALEHDRRAIAIYEQVRGPGHPALAMPLNNLATSLLDSGDLVGARRMYERARTIWEASPGAAREGLHLALHGLARVSLEEGKYEESLRDQELALATLDAQLGPDHPEGWQILQGMAEALLELGRPREPRDRAARAIAVTEAAFGPDHPTLVGSLTVAANAALQLGDVAAAQGLLGRASPILAATDLPQLVRADFLLARAGAARTAGARAEARALATEARTYAADAGASGARVLAAIDAWLAETPGR